MPAGNDPTISVRGPGGGKENTPAAGSIPVADSIGAEAAAAISAWRAGRLRSGAEASPEAVAPHGSGARWRNGHRSTRPAPVEDRDDAMIARQLTSVFAGVTAMANRDDGDDDEAAVDDGGSLFAEAITLDLGAVPGVSQRFPRESERLASTEAAQLLAQYAIFFCVPPLLRFRLIANTNRSISLPDVQMVTPAGRHIPGAFL